jgi:hypothetical protein
MFRTLSSRAATLAAGVALVSALFSSQPAHAQATLTITDSTCTGFTVGGSPGALTITCAGSTGGGGGGPSAPSGCTASANPAGRRRWRDHRLGVLRERRADELRLECLTSCLGTAANHDCS